MESGLPLPHSVPALRRLRRASLVAACLAFLLCVGGAAEAAAQVTITRMSHDNSVFYIDTSPSGTPTPLLAAYVAYKITNPVGGHGDYSDLRVELKSFVGTVLTLDPSEVNPVSLGALADGASTTAFFYLNASGATTTAQSHTVEVVDLTGPTVVGTLSSSFTTVSSTIDANPNKVDSVRVTPNPAFVNSIVTIRVYGRTGSSGNACPPSCKLSFTPAAFQNWPVDALRLISTSIAFSSGSLNGVTLTNDLYHQTTTDFTDSRYTATYKFRVDGTTSSPANVSPIGYINSGNPIKHTDTGNFATLETVKEPIELTVTKDVAHEPSSEPFADVISLDAPSDVDPNVASTLVVKYRIKVEAKKGVSGTPTAATVPKLVDTLPNPADALPSDGTVTYVSPSVDPMPPAEPGEPSVSGSTLTWTSVDIDATGELTFTFEATLPNNVTQTNPRFLNVIEVRDGDDNVLDSDSARILVSGLLPVELVAFDAVLSGRSLTLRWETASETNNAGFEIQQRYASSAGDWKTLGWVDGQGTTLEAQAYSYRIDDLEPGRHAFRLKQIDYDGSFEHSPVIEVAVEMPESYLITEIYPNPFNPQATFSFGVRQQQQVVIEVFDMLGRRVQELYRGTPQGGVTQTVFLDGSRLTSGTYVVRVLGEHFVDSQPFTVVK